MSEFGRLPKYAAAVLLSLGATGCGETIKDDIFPDLRCDEVKDNSDENAYGLKPGERVQFGHPYADSDGMKADASVTLTPEGTLAASSNNRPNGPKVTIQASETSGGIVVTAGNERFDITSVPKNGGQLVNIAGTCIKEG